jgi:hypothetical protein
MWLLLDELEDLHPRCSIQDGAMAIEGFRLFIAGERMLDTLLYIGTSGDFFGSDVPQTVLAHRSDLIIIDDIAASVVFNRIISVFDKYRQWSEALDKARFRPNKYQAILDVAHELFQCPVFFGSTNMHIYAITRQYTKEQVFDEWDGVKQLNTMPVDLLELLKAYNFPQQFPTTVDPAVMPSWPGARFEYQIRINCYLDGKVWGHFFMYYYKKTVTRGALQLARFVGDVYSQVLQETHEKSFEQFSRYSWLIDILDGQNVPRDSILPLYWSLKWSETDSLILYRITPSSSGYDQALILWISQSVSEHSANTIAFPYHDSVVVIMREGNKQSQAALDSIIRLINIGDHHCGISFPFRGLHNIAVYYKQAGYAVRLAPASDNKIHAFNDCMLDGLVIEIRAHLNWKDWVLPSLFRLLESDATQGTEYYTTLYYLMVNKGHLGNTAKVLYIHRNTLLYRIERIENLIGADIRKESIYTYLRLCFELMMEEYPVAIRPQPAEAGGE